MWFDRISDSMDLPQDLATLPFSGKWKGADTHAESPSSEKFQYELSAMRVSGLYSILSGGLVWLANRLKLKTDTAAIEDLAVALFCYQQDPNYYSSPASRPTLDEVDNADRFNGPVLYVLDEWYDHRTRSNASWPVYIPHHMIGEMLNLTKFTLGVEHRGIFEQWFVRMVERADKVVPYSNRYVKDYDVSEAGPLSFESMGMPLPPSFISLRSEPDVSTFPEQWSDFLRSISDEDNMFLRPSSEIEALVFGGKPYESGR